MRKDPPSFTPRGLAMRMNRWYFWERAARGMRIAARAAGVSYSASEAHVLAHATDRARHRGDLTAWLYIAAVERKAGRQVLS